MKIAIVGMGFVGKSLSNGFKKSVEVLGIDPILNTSIKDLFDTSGTNETWENFTSALSVDKRIGDSHMQVPGPDGRLGFGGACFPKDSSAFLQYSNEANSKINLLNTAINLNNVIRSQYNNLTQSEIRQNISFFKGDKS